MYVCMYYIFIFFELGRIAYMRTDGYFQPCATIVRAIDEAKAALESRGYTLVPFEHPDGKIMNLRTLIFSFHSYISRKADHGSFSDKMEPYVANG